jgi:hypothetical protein
MGLMPHQSGLTQEITLPALIFLLKCKSNKPFGFACLSIGKTEMQTLKTSLL